MCSSGCGCRLWRLGLAVGVLLGGSQAASAGFFDDCVADDATIMVSQNTAVKNENVTLKHCTIEVAEGAQLQLQNVKINVDDEEYVEFRGGDTSKLVIRNTSINACDSDISGFESVTITHSTFVDPPDTCDVKEMEAAGSISIISSVLVTHGGGDSDVHITSDFGNVTLRNTSIVAADDVHIQAKIGSTTVHANSITAVEHIEIVASGAATATANAFQAGGMVTITGNPCTSRNNNPAVACSP